MRGRMSRRDHWAEVSGDKMYRNSEWQRERLHRNNSMPFLRQPVKEDEESNKLVCKWQPQNSNQVDSYGQEGVRCRSNSNNYDYMLSCRCCRKRTGSDTSRGNAGHSRRTRGEIWSKHHTPDFVYVCDSYEAVDCPPKQPKTTVYLCDMPKYTPDNASPKRTKRPHYTIGSKRDIAPQYNHNTKYNIRAPALPPAKGFQDVVCTSGAGNALTFRCAKYKRQQKKGILRCLWQFITSLFIGLIRFIFICSICFLVLFCLLVFINFNSFGHYCVLALIVLFLHMLLMEPGNLWIHYYLK